MQDIKVHFGASDSDVAYLRGLGCNLVTDPGSRVNKHAAAAVERLLGERAVLRDFAKVGKNLVDVYSNAARMRRSVESLGLDVKVIPLIPSIVQNDRARQCEATREGIPWIDCRFEDFEYAEPVDAYTFTHALYYVDPLILASRMVNQGVNLAYSVQHNFTQAAAAICNGAVKYHYTEDCTIKCTADGDDHVYEHGAMHWIHGPAINIMRCGEPVNLSWYLLDKIGDTFVYKFELKEGHVDMAAPVEFGITDTADPEIAPVGNSLNLVTTLNRELKSPTVELAYVPVTKAVFFYGLYGVQVGSGKFIPMPRGLIGILAKEAAGEVRTPALYRLLLARAKNVLSSYNFPADMQAKAAVHAAVTAMVVAVEIETVELGVVLRAYRRLFYLHSRVLDFEPAYVVGARTVLAASALAGSTIIPMHYYRVDLAAIGLVKAAACVAVAHPFVSIPIVLAAGALGKYHLDNIRSHHIAEANQWAKFRANLMPGPTGTVVHFDVPPSFKASNVPKTVAPVLRESVRITSHADYHQPDVNSLERKGLRLHGIGISTSTPSYVAKTQSNAINGLSSRMFAAPEHKSNIVDWAPLFRQLRGWGSGYLNRFRLGPLRNFNAGTEEAWVSRFPSSTQKNLREAGEDLVAHPLTKKDLKLAGIVKQEKTGTIDISGELPVADARIVMAGTARINRYLGPRLWAMGCIFKKRFALRRGEISWDSGFSSEELGQWLQESIAARSRPGKPARILIWDQSRFEKHQRKHCQQASNIVLEEAGADEEFVAVNAAWHKLNGSMQGMPISFKSDEHGMISGGNDTAWRNFLINCAACVHALGDPGPRYDAVIKGDDGIAVLDGEDEVTFEEFAANNNCLGLSVTGKITTKLSEVEFASNIPYPTADGLVFGPKIGRTLQRFGWTISSAPSDVYGAATSLLETTHHIPFLRQFIDTHRRLGEPSEKRYFAYKTLAREFHEPCPETYAFIAERYGLTAGLEQAFEERLKMVESLPCVIDWPIIDTLVDIDA
jgi:hypothetical protein